MTHVLSGRKTGTVRFSTKAIIEDESKTTTSKITSSPVEDIGDIADSVIPNAASMNIKGTIGARGGAKSTLERMQSEGDILWSVIIIV